MRCIPMQQMGNDQGTRTITTISTPCFHLYGCFHVFHYMSPKVKKQINHHGGCWHNFQICSFLLSTTPIYPNIDGSSFHGPNIQASWHVNFHCVWSRPHFHWEILERTFQALGNVTPTQYNISSPNISWRKSSEQIFGDLFVVLHFR